jgi:hypothetical protein
MRMSSFGGEFLREIKPCLGADVEATRPTAVGQFEFLLRLKESTNVHDA